MEAEPTPRADRPPHRSAVPELLVVVASAALQLVVLVPFTVASGLLAPLWAVVGLYAVWVAAAWWLALLARRRPLMTPLAPTLNAAVLVLAVTLGERLLGWTP